MKSFILAIALFCVLPAAYAQVAGYAWETSQWTTCSKTCGGGISVRTVQCFNTALGRKGIDEACANVQKPASSASCNTQACSNTQVVTYSWFTGSYSACNRDCGTGRRQRSLNCVNSNFVPVDFTFCSGIARPVTEEVCNTQTCTSNGISWVIGTYATCTKPCADAVTGAGTSDRNVQCVRTTTTNGVTTTTKLVDEACDQPKPVSRVTCNTALCSANTWYTGAWSTCTQTCGGFGTRDRVVECRNAAGATTEIAGCDQSIRPPTRERCGTQACGVPPSGYAWKVGTYGACSVTCGTGVAFRDVVCVDVGFRHVDDSFCINANLAKPVNSQSCTGINGACQPNKWFVGEWGNCLTATGCGAGVQYRGVFCQNFASAGLPDAQCSTIGTKPASVQSCSRTACQNPTTTNYWYTGSFGACQPGNIAYRQVTCVTPQFTTVTDAECASAGTKPSTSGSCVYAPSSTGTSGPTSYGWLIGEWSTCSASTCGQQGTQTRSFTCVAVVNGVPGSTVANSNCGNLPGATSQACTRAGC